MLPGINSTLFHHLASGGGVSSVLRRDCPAVVALTNKFIGTRTDIRRLQEAQRVASDILRRNDLVDLIAIRDIVAKQELRRMIRYKKQQDHTAHTVYLFLLGLWFYDHIPAVKEAIIREAQHSGITDPLDEYFLLQWIYSSLLHDIGYAFNNLSRETKPDRKLLDGVFSEDWVTKQYDDPLSSSTKAVMQAAVSEWRSRYGSSLTFGLANFKTGQYREALDRLSQVPWLGSLIPDLADMDAFDILDPKVLGLREYAVSVADNGYNGQGRCIDHAIGSGLFLLQYTSFWYWILNYVRHTNKQAYLEAAGNYNYDPLNLTTDFIPACRAVAFHNVLPVTPVAKGIINSLSLHQYPLVYLSILCDELQRWDRYPSGDQLLKNYLVYASSSLESGDLSLSCSLPAGDHFLRARLLINEPFSEYANSINDSLSERLPDYKKILEIRVH